MTVSRGITPGVCILAFPAKPELNATVGDLTIWYEGQKIVFKNCAVNTHSLRREQPTGFTTARRSLATIYTVQVLDRRWAWRYKKISGEYNVRLPDNTIRYSGSKHPELRKSIYELAILCLQAMGESGYDATALPNFAYPHVKWENANPAAELQTLCDMVGCVVVYDWDQDRVTIQRLGMGSPLPEMTGAKIHEIMPVVVSRKPDSIAVECGANRYQVKFELEAVGMEPDGSIKKIDDLSYKPAGGWGKQWWCDFPEVSADAKDLAFRTVFRWYRIKSVGKTGGLSVSGVNEQIKSVDQFELEDVLLERGKDFDGMPQTQRGRINGEFWPQCPWEEVTEEDDEYNSSYWRILPDHKNIIEFDYPVLKITDGSYEQAKLYVTATCKIRKENGAGYISETYSRALPWLPTGAGTRLLRHHELWSSQVISSISGGAGSNQNELMNEAYVYLDYMQQFYQSGPSQDVSYAGILPIRLDGAIAQVQWKCGVGMNARTRASRNHEFDIFTPSMEYRRRMEKLDTFAEVELT